MQNSTTVPPKQFLCNAEFWNSGNGHYARTRCIQVWLTHDQSFLQLSDTTINATKVPALLSKCWPHASLVSIETTRSQVGNAQHTDPLNHNATQSLKAQMRGCLAEHTSLNMQAHTVEYWRLWGFWYGKTEQENSHSITRFQDKNIL